MHLGDLLCHVNACRACLLCAMVVSSARQHVQAVEQCLIAIRCADAEVVLSVRSSALPSAAPL